MGQNPAEAAKGVVCKDCGGALFEQRRETGVIGQRGLTTIVRYVCENDHTAATESCENGTVIVRHNIKLGIRSC